MAEEVKSENIAVQSQDIVGEKQAEPKEKEVIDPLTLIVPSLPKQVATQEELVDIAARHALWLESVLLPRAVIGHGRANFAGTDIKHLNFSGLNFSGASFKSCDAEGVDFTAGILNGCEFSDAKLSGAKFTNAKLKHSRFHRAQLEGVNFDGADTQRAEFQLARGLQKHTDEQSAEAESVQAKSEQAPLQAELPLKEKGANELMH